MGWHWDLGIKSVDGLVSKQEFAEWFEPGNLLEDLT